MKQLFAILFLFATLSYSNVQSDSIQKVIASTYPLTDHPRLYFLAADEAALRLKITNTAPLQTIQNVIFAECEKICLLAPKTYVITGNRILDVSREVLRRVSFLSFAARITTDAALKTKYANRAIQEMLSAAAFQDWHPDADFLGTSEMTMALAIGYDWLYNFTELDSTEKTTIASAIKTKGIEQATGASLVKRTWLNANNNWNQVCNAGISAGVAAVYDENPTYYQALIDRAITSIKIPMAEYKFNGAFTEGFMYAEYGTPFNVMFIDMLKVMWGSDSGLSALPGFMLYGDFITHLQGNATKQLVNGSLNTNYPRSFNFSDCFIYNPLMPDLYWFAKQSANSNFLYNEYNKISKASSSTITNSAKDHRLLPFMLIWSKDLSLSTLIAPTTTSFTTGGANPLAAFRTGWAASDIYFAIKGGRVANSHGHMDVGSFVMEANDVRWAMDFGMSDYAKIEAQITSTAFWNLGQSSLRWNVFRYNNMSHNVLTFNGKYQLVSDTAKLENYMVNATSKSVDVVLTPIYKNEVKSYRRTGAIVSNRYVEVKDEVQAGTTNLNTFWNMVTEAVPTKISNKIICLKQATKTLYMVFEGTNNVSSEIRSTKPSTSYEEQNAGTYFVGFAYTIPANTTQTVTVKLVPEGDPILQSLLLTSVDDLFADKLRVSPTASFDAMNHQIIVTNLLEGQEMVKLFDLNGKLLEVVQVNNGKASFFLKNSFSKILIIQILDANGKWQSLKVVC